MCWDYVLGLCAGTMCWDYVLGLRAGVATVDAFLCCPVVWCGVVWCGLLCVLRCVCVVVCYMNVQGSLYSPQCIVQNKSVHVTERCFSSMCCAVLCWEFYAMLCCAVLWCGVSCCEKCAKVLWQRAEVATVTARMSSRVSLPLVRGWPPWHCPWLTWRGETTAQAGAVAQVVRRQRRVNFNRSM
jgi:hypothetical protein